MPGQFVFSSFRNHYPYLDTLYFCFENCIIFGYSKIMVFVVGECVCEGVHGSKHQGICIITVT